MGGRWGPVLITAVLLSCTSDESAPSLAPQPPRQSADPPRAERSPVIIATANVAGLLTPCACASGPRGGVARRARALTAARDRWPDRTIYVDAGDHFFSSRHPPTVGSDTSSAARGLLADVLAASRVRAIAVGDRDLALGLDALKALADRAGAPLVSANVDAPQVEPFVIETIKDMQIALIGATPSGAYPGRLRVGPSAAAVARAADAARRRGADFLLGLLHLPPDQAREIMRHAKLDAAIAGDSTAIQAEGTEDWLGAGELSEGLLELELARAGPKVRFAPLELADPEASSVLERVRAIQGPASGAKTYGGAKTCRPCHPAAFAFWRTTPHASAFVRLRLKRQTRNRDCFPCHATGFGRPGGPRNLKELKGLFAVGCEACHGPGQTHAADPTVRLGPVSEGRCAECHRLDPHQAPFSSARRREQVLGPGHGRPL